MALSGSYDHLLAALPAEQQRVTAHCDWRAAGLIIICSWVLVLGVFWETVDSMVQAWSQSRTFVHGFFVLPVTAFLIWAYRGRLTALAPKPNYGGLLVLAATGGAWILSNEANVLVLQQLAVVGMLPGLVWTVLGTPVIRGLGAPLSFLFFAVPVGTSLEPWLQYVTASFVVSSLELSGTPVLWDGVILTIPTGSWDIARDCAGLRYLLPGMAVGYLYAILIYQRWTRRFVFLLACAVALIVANGLRAYGVIMGDHLGFAVGTDHRVFSYSIYSLTIGALFWLGLRWRQPDIFSARFRSRDPNLHPLISRGGNTSSSRGLVLTAISGVALLGLAPLCVWLYRTFL